MRHGFPEVIYIGCEGDYLDEFLKIAISGLSQAASNPLAFVAYLFVIGGWTIIAFRVKRNNQILQHLEKLPEGDRLRVLEVEMGKLPLASDLSPEQWLQSKNHFYYLLGFCAILMVFVIVFVVAAATTQLAFFTVGAISFLALVGFFGLFAVYRSRIVGRRADVDVSLFQGGKRTQGETLGNIIGATLRSQGQEGREVQLSDVEPVNDYDETGGYSSHADAEFTVNYAYERKEGSIQIRPQMPYLTRLASGGPVQGKRYWYSPFQWQFPKLSIKAVNNSERTLLLTEVAIKVRSSEINKEPVLIIRENFWNIGKIELWNEGWGDMVNAVIHFNLFKSNTYYSELPFENTSKSINIGTFSKQTEVSVIDHVPPELQKEKLVCVFGVIRYTTEGREERAVRFQTQVSLVKPGPGLPRPPEYLYDVFLKAGKAGYVKNVPISQEINPGEADHFLVRIATDKSARFNLALEFRDAGNSRIAEKPVELEVFVPRSQTRYIVPQRGGGIPTNT